MPLLFAFGKRTPDKILRRTTFAESSIASFCPARVVLSGIGEPLVNPQFFSLVDVLAERQIQCEFFTNGTLLTARMQQAILARRNIDLLIISCDGAEKATFENLQAGANFESWKQLVQELRPRRSNGLGKNCASASMLLSISRTFTKSETLSD